MPLKASGSHIITYCVGRPGLFRRRGREKKWLEKHVSYCARRVWPRTNILNIHLYSGVPWMHINYGECGERAASGSRGGAPVVGDVGRGG